MNPYKGYRRDTLREVIRSFFVVVLLGFFTVASAQLPPEIRVDRYLILAE